MSLRAYVLAALVAVAGCNPATEQMVVRDATVIANAARLSIETAQTAAVTLYKAQQIAAVQASKKEGLDRAEAVARVEVLRREWEPVWTAFEKVRLGHALLVAALEAYDQGKEIVREGERVAAALTEVLARAKALTDAKNQLAVLLAHVRGDP